MSSLCAAQTFLQPAQAQVREDCQHGGGNCAGQNYLVVDHGQAAENIFAQAACADRSRDRGQTDGDHGGNPHAGDDHAERQRQLTCIAIGDLSCPCRVRLRPLRDPHLDAGVSVANQWQQRVESERKNREAVGARADPGRRQQKSEQRQAGNSLNNVRSAEHRLA